MWHEIPNNEHETAFAWRKVDDRGRIIGRIDLKDSEYGASKLELNDEGVGKRVHKGFYLTLENAKAAVDG